MSLTLEMTVHGYRVIVMSKIKKYTSTFFVSVQITARQAAFIIHWARSGDAYVRIYSMSILRLPIKVSNLQVCFRRTS
jgi:hypothetical protein